MDSDELIEELLRLYIFEFERDQRLRDDMLESGWPAEMTKGESA